MRAYSRIALRVSKRLEEMHLGGRVLLEKLVLGILVLIRGSVEAVRNRNHHGFETSHDSYDSFFLCSCYVVGCVPKDGRGVLRVCEQVCSLTGSGVVFEWLGDLRLRVFLTLYTV